MASLEELMGAWDEDTQLSLCMEFVGERELEAEFAEFLEYKAEMDFADEDPAYL